jgi:predicted nucleic acid-binding protein
LTLVDSSVWIDFFSPSPGSAGGELRRMIGEDEPLVLAGVIVAEVLQGLTRDVRRIERYLAQWDLVEPRGFETYEHAAAIFRAARVKGIALTTIDTVIAAIALEQGASVFTLDQDFARIARITPLVLYRS